jgi:hypothetical protein
MGGLKRLTASKKIVAGCDPALANFPRLLTKKIENDMEVPDVGLIPYGSTLDISYLGNLDDLPYGGPMVFEVMPLQTRYINWDRGEDTDYKTVFQCHVIGIERCDFKAELNFEQLPGFNYKTLDDKSVDLFFASFIKEIAHKIIELSKVDGCVIPFSTLGSSTAILQRCQVAQLLNLESARSAAAKVKD